MKRILRLLAFLLVAIALANLIVRRVRSDGRWRGVVYRVSGRHPDPDVDDHTLADRVRSSLGPVEKRLDLPHVHVMVNDHVVTLHGDVEWPHERATIEQAAREVSGVKDVVSHLHVGLLRSDSRPSGGTRSHRTAISAS